MSRKKTVIISLVLFIIVVGFGAALWSLKPGESKSSFLQEIESAQGGAVELRDDTRLVIHPGGLSQDAQVVISVPATLPPAAQPPAGENTIIREVTAIGAKLTRPAWLTIHYDELQNPDMLSPDAVLVGVWNGQAWEYLGGEVDPQAKTIGVMVDHLSIFGIFSLPSLDTIFSDLKILLSKCSYQSNPNTDWTLIGKQLTPAYISQAPDEVIWVYNVTDLKTFVAVNDSCIFANPTWFDGEVNKLGLPDGKKKVFLEELLGHEISHIVRNTTIVDYTHQALRQALNDSGIQYLMREYGVFLRLIVDACRREKYDAVIPILKYFNDELPGMVINLLKDQQYCVKTKQAELNADVDGAIWTSRLEKDTNQVGLIFAEYWDEIGSIEHCFHPSGKVRAENIRYGIAMGSAGGVLGRIAIEGVNPGVQCSFGDIQAYQDVSIKVDGAPADKSDCWGRFLVTGLPTGWHTIVISKPGFMPYTLSVDVPFADLLHASVELKKQPSPTPTFSPTPTLPATPTATSLPTATPTPIPTNTLPPPPTSPPLPQLASADIGLSTPLYVSYDPAQWKERSEIPGLKHRTYKGCYFGQSAGMGGNQSWRIETQSVRIGNFDYYVENIYEPNSGQLYFRTYQLSMSNGVLILQINTIELSDPGQLDSCIWDVEQILAQSEDSLLSYQP